MATGGSGNKLGYAFFIVNDGINEAANFQGVEGSHADLDIFRSVFEYGLGFEWVNSKLLHRNLTLAQWDHTKDSQNEVADKEKCCIMCLIKRLDFTNVEYVMVGISTHGLDIKGKAVLQFFNGTYIHVDDIMVALSDKKLPALKGKKRIIVANSCRIDVSSAEKAGDRGLTVDVESTAGVQPMDTSDVQPTRRTQPLSRIMGTAGVQPMDTGNNQPTTSTQPLSSGSSSSSPKPNVRRLERQNSIYSSYIGQPDDFLIVHGAPPGRSAKTNSIGGSWLLCALRDVVVAHDFSRPLNLIQAITKANGIMSRRETIVRDREGQIDPVKSEQKNCLYFTNTLTSLPMIVRAPERPIPAPVPPLYSLEHRQETAARDLPTNYSLFGDDERDSHSPMDQTRPKNI